jgi:putative membrane protein
VTASVRALLLLWIALAVPAVAWSYPDESFYKAFVESGIAEIDAAKLALQKSSNDKLKEFAALMVKDHTAANDMLKQMRSGLPGSASAAQQAIQQKLGMLSGSVFDQFYILAQIHAYEDLLELVNDEIASGRDAKAKAFASEILPTVQTHLKMIRVLAAGEGVSR